MIILDRLLMGGIGFVLDKVASAVDAEMNDERSLREDLLAAQMSLELGEMDEEEFAEVERDVLARLREIREERQATGAVSLEGGGFEVDVSFRGDENE
jgi:hypothetical protein